MNFETDYTEERNIDTFKGGTFQRYRVIHWLEDVLKNFFSDPTNIKDERISKLLQLHDREAVQRFFLIGVPYAQDATMAGTTPMIVVSLGETSYPVNTFNLGASLPIAANNAMSRSSDIKHKVTRCNISIVTESYDGTVLLTDLVEDFLTLNEKLFKIDNPSISEFHVLGCSAPSMVKQGTASNAKSLYQMTIMISIAGGISWVTDTQGPVYRGMHVQNNIANSN